MTPLEKYRSDLDRGAISADAQQLRVVESLNQLHQQLLPPGRRSPLRRLLQRVGLAGAAAPAPRGIYLWGGVGRGKTYLMDLFFETVPSDRKLRTHFHRFMQRVHQGLARYQGRKNPLQAVAGEIADEAVLLCFDEFFVLDIGDAMILAGLLEALFERGVVLVATSNIHPDGLYENGLQRARFLPAIDLIKSCTRVIELGSGTDYRLRQLSQATLYHYPPGVDTEPMLRRSLLALAPDRLELEEDTVLNILGREIECRYCAGDVAWFTFQALCDGPRSAFDYVEIARLFHAIILSDVPALTEVPPEQTRRFINLVDEFYDRRVKLILAAAAPLEALYRGQALAFEFERTRSRLIEMQSHEYLGSGHRG